VERALANNAAANLGVVNETLQMWILTAFLLLLAITLAGVLLREKKAVRHFRGALDSVTKQARLESARTDAILKSMPDGIMVMDSNLRLLEWNTHFSEFSGVPNEMLHVGLDLRDVLRAQAEAGEFGLVDAEIEVSRRVALIQSGASTGSIERRRPNGNTLELRRSPLAGGGFVTLYTDISSRRDAEQQLRQAQKMEAIGYLVGGMAHDFNNLLTVVIGNLELAQQFFESSDFLQAQRKVEAAQNGAQRAATLTERLLAFARQQNLEPQPLDANKVVAEMSEMIRHSIGSDVEFETVLAGGLWEAMADQNQLENALLNLAINARDAMPEGGKITIETANAYLDAAYAAAHEEVLPGQYVLVAVSDGGLGMTPEEATQAFQPFYTTKGIGKGSGLGLSQVFGFVKQSSGHVKIYSEVGVGTTVKIYLPRVIGQETPVTETKSASPALPHAREQETVLVVDDDVDVLAYSVNALETLGYHVIGTQDAPSALRALEEHPKVGLLFTDVQLPGLNGQELAEEITRRRPDLAVLFTTGYSVNAVVHRGILNQGTRSLNKPFSLAELAAGVREALDGRDRGKALVSET
jgi:signal transduction histidine kinase/ActR/RegA family two-component response regulator